MISQSIIEKNIVKLNPFVAFRNLSGNKLKSLPEGLFDTLAKLTRL